MTVKTMYLTPPADCLRVTAATTAQANLAKSLFFSEALIGRVRGVPLKKKKRKQKKLELSFLCFECSFKTQQYLQSSWRARGSSKAKSSFNSTVLFVEKRLLQMLIQTYRLEGRAVVEKKNKKKKLHAVWPVVVLFSERHAEEG